MDAHNVKGDHPPRCAKKVIHFAGLLHREGRHVQRAFAKAGYQYFFSRKDAEVADLPLGDDIAFVFVLAGKPWLLLAT